MNSSFFTAIAVLEIAALANTLAGAWLTHDFLREVTCINSFHSMERFKRYAATQMYQALLQIGFLGLPFLLFTYGMIQKSLNPWGFIAVIGPTLVILIISVKLKAMEKRIANLPVDETYKAEFAHVYHVWMNEPFPTW
ncbi:MAG: hypothetical protein AMXMBFR84_46700 [Candidatus Hydrogenedentota bacterium]